MEDGNVKLRVFTSTPGDGMLQDYAVELPGNTPVSSAQVEVKKVLLKRLGHDKFRITGVSLYPHWNKRRDGDGTA